MLPSFLRSKKRSKKWDKEVSLVVDDPHNPDGYVLKVTRQCLLDHSQFFRNKQEELKKSKRIHLPEVSITALQKIVEYMQKSSVVFLNHIEVIETLKASHKYQVESMLEICSNHLLTTLEPGNVCDVYEVAFSLQLSHLEYLCLKLIDQSADVVLASRGFLLLSRDPLKEIIKRNTLNVSSEVVVFSCVLGWSFNDCLRRGVDAGDVEQFIPTVKSLFNQVRFGAMSDVELCDPDVSKYRSLLASPEPWNRIRTASVSSQDGAWEKLARKYVSRYTHDLSPHEATTLSSVKSGETFHLNVEVLKGKVFFTGFRLVFSQFATTKSDACLSVLLTATNTVTQEQKTARGTFLNVKEEASLTFGVPMKVVETQNVEFVLSVKRAENICPLSVDKDIQIAMPESKVVALKVMPMSSSGIEDVVRCIFQELEYFC